MSDKKYFVTVVGATGLIGRTLIKVLEDVDFPVEKLKLLASEKSEGKKIPFKKKYHVVRRLDAGSFGETELAFFCAGADVARKYAHAAAQAGAYVIDNSSAFRNDPDVPLIIPEINGEALKWSSSRIISNPNCSTIQAILPLKKPDEKFGLKSIVLSTYQAVSGSGQKGIDDLAKGTNRAEYPAEIRKTAICRIGKVTENGYTDEEIKALNETRKIFGKNIRVSATCVRVPVKNCHGVSVEARFERDFTLSEIAELLSQSEGVELNELPNSVLSDGNGKVFVGRIRKSTAADKTLCYYCSADNTLKGAALNAVQIAEKLIGYKKIQKNILF